MPDRPNTSSTRTTAARLPVQTDAGMGTRLRAGLIVLQSDETMENELRGLFSAPGVALYHSRIPSAAEVTPRTLAQMEKDLPRVAAALPAGLDIIGYGCTSGATIIGQDRVAALAQRSHPGAAVTDPITAVMAACRHLGARRIGLLTPYVPSVTDAMRALLEASGFAVTAVASFEQSSEATVARITEAATLGGLQQLAVHGAAGRRQCDILFASCTNLRSFGIIEAAEAATGLPVISSNLALGWAMLAAGGALEPGRGPGRLFAAPPPVPSLVARNA